FKHDRGTLVVCFTCSYDNALGQHHLLFKSADGRPERHLQHVCLPFVQRLRGKSMTHVTAVTQYVFVVYFPESTVTIGTRELRYFPEPLDTGNKLVAFHLLFRDSRFNLDIVRHGIPLFLVCHLTRQSVQQRWNLT